MSVRTSLVSGTLLALVGGAAAINGSTVLLVTGTDSAVTSGAVSVVSPGSAVVTADGDLDARGTEALGVTLSLAVTGEKPVFVGVGPAADVDRYLAGAATDTVEDLELRPLRVTTEHRDGAARPGPPGDQTFWRTQSDGTRTGTARWPVQDGDHRAVVMNADGSPGVRARVTTTVGVQHLTAVAAWLLGGGLAALLTGTVVLLRARRRPSLPQAPPLPVDPFGDQGDDGVRVESDRRDDQPARSR